MNPDSENFESLKQLLALKRYEQPPPGYFDRFSREVTSRIKAGERGGETGLEGAFGEMNWFQRLLGAFDTKPVFAGAFGAAVCALLISGIISSEQTSVISSAVATGAPNSSPTLTPDGLANISFSQPMIESSTNPVAASSVGSLFDQFQLKAAPASFSPAGQ
jgi:hypothetical protein